MVSSCLDFIVTVAGLLEYWSGRWDMLNRSKGILALYSSIGGIVRLHLLAPESFDLYLNIFITILYIV